MKKILIVDDRAEIRELVEATLESGNYKILKAESGEESVETALKEKPDLILMDIMMPEGIDGIEAARRIKSNPETSDIIIIMLTAKGQESDFEKGYEAGANDYFVKPFSPLKLIKKVEEILKS